MPRITAQEAQIRVLRAFQALGLLTGTPKSHRGSESHTAVPWLYDDFPADPPGPHEAVCPRCHLVGARALLGRGDCPNCLEGGPDA